MRSQKVEIRLHWLDSLRGFAALWVVLFHLNTVEYFRLTLYQRFVNLGWLGVIIFFVVSGIGIQSSTQRVSSLQNYIRNRIYRIYPPYIASLGLTLTLICLRKMLYGTNDFIRLPQGVGGWMAAIFLMTRPVTDYPAINWVYWSLGYEVAFYILLGITVANKSLKWPILIAVSLGACLVGPHPPQVIFFLRYWSFFALGAALAEWRVRHGIMPIVLLALCVVDFVRNQSLIMVFAAAMTAVSCWACMTPVGAWMNKERLFRWAGRWSYSLYLIHVPVGCWISLRVIAALFGPGVRQLSLAQHVLADAACLIASCAVALIFSAFVEGPSIAMMRTEMTHPFKARTLNAPNETL